LTEFQDFKTITVGGCDREQLIRRLVDAGVQFNAYAHALFENPAFAPSETTEAVRLVKIKISDIGVAEPCSLEDVLDRASAVGLKPCSLDLAAFLRLEYLDQPAGPYLTVASLRAATDEKQPCGFYIRNNAGSLWLRGYQVDGKIEWPKENEFVFRTS
jgi:hypothetical protein